MTKQARSEIRAHWTRVAALGCIVTGGPAEIAHCHGGSMRDLGYTKTRGKKQPWMDWLVLPLAPEYHRWRPDALDVSVERFELKYGKQVDWLDTICAALGVDVWKRMRNDHPDAWMPREEPKDHRRHP